ncbi:fasciclin domain-containing protein [Acidovorax sp. SUPP3334]|uniref:fasciclin domain-containing protein n=1 Tax=Acidovorax sp. SUPP3334 TaxID=2920881 RepID=UPI0023DE29DB|nr:fasciclin domain-containing protein [Acidovorax sp. SUPP3334]GKT24520.1 fasciclin domain-containing protein [Acidovorax sp. SUPP3334]
MYRRYLFPVLLAAITVSTLSACATAPNASSPIPVALAATPSISTFRTLATQAGLADTLAAAGPYTVFAPSDDAFKAVPAKTMAELRADKAKLQAVLNYHIVPKRLTAADVQSGSVKTLQGGEITLARAGTFVTLEDAMVVQADILASNGVVHVVDRVLLPPAKK